MVSAPAGAQTAAVGAVSEPLAAGRGRSPVATSYAAKAVELVGLVALATVVPRLLGPTGYGDFALATAVVALGSLTMSLGGPTLMARFVPASAPADRAAVARALGERLGLWRALQIVVVVGAGAVLIAVDPGTFPPLLTALVITALALDVAATLLFQIALGLGRATAWSFRFPIQNALLIAGALLLGTLAGSRGAVAAVTVASAGALVMGASVVARPLRRAARGAALPSGAMRFGVFHVLGGLFLHFHHRGGVIAVALLAGSSVETGFAGLAIGISLTAMYAVTQGFVVQLPRLAEQAGADLGGAEAAGRRLARLTLLGLVPLGLLGALLVDPLLPVVLGEGFAGAAASFGPALAMLPLAPLTALSSQAAALRLRPELRLATTAAGALAFALVAVVTIPAWGATGATAALLAGAVATVLVARAVLPGVLSASVLAAGLGGAAAVLALSVLAS